MPDQVLFVLRFIRDNPRATTAALGTLFAYAVQAGIFSGPLPTQVEGYVNLAAYFAAGLLFLWGLKQTPPEKPATPSEEA
jgi:hypothetical protein